MIDYLTLFNNFGLPGLGTFIGCSMALRLWCPNRRCCQLQTIRKVVEHA